MDAEGSDLPVACYPFETVNTTLPSTVSRPYAVTTTYGLLLKATAHYEHRKQIVGYPFTNVLQVILIAFPGSLKVPLTPSILSVHRHRRPWLLRTE